VNRPELLSKVAVRNVDLFIAIGIDLLHEDRVHPTPHRVAHFAVPEHKHELILGNLAID